MNANYADICRVGNFEADYSPQKHIKTKGSEK